MTRLSTGFKALRQLGLEQPGLYELYQLGLRTGYYRRSLSPSNPFPISTPFSIPHFSSIDQFYPLTSADQTALLVQADEICRGQVRLFGGPPTPLNLSPPGLLAHWTEYELGRSIPPGP